MQAGYSGTAANAPNVNIFACLYKEVNKKYWVPKFRNVAGNRLLAGILIWSSF